MNGEPVSEHERVLIGFLAAPITATTFGGFVFPLVYQTLPPGVLPDVLL